MEKIVSKAGRFTGVGLLNSLIGFSVIIVLQKQINPVLANLAGYMAGIISGYLLHSKYTFSSKRSAKTALMFMASVLISYLGNCIVLIVLIQVNLNLLIAQLIAIAAYTIINFTFNNMVTFKSDL